MNGNGMTPPNGSHREPLSDDELRLDVRDLVDARHRHRKLEIFGQVPPPIPVELLTPELVEFLEAKLPCDSWLGSKCTDAAPCPNCITRRRYVALDDEEKRRRRLEKIIDDGPSTGYRFTGIGFADFLRKDYRREWLVKRLLVRGEPAIVAGTKKTLKTSTGLDLGISLASGTPFLGHFDVYRPLRVVFISGESGHVTIQDVARRVVEAKGIDPDTLQDRLILDFDLPQIGRPIDVAELSRALADRGADVMLLDPVYLCLLAGGARREASNLFDMGERLLAVSRACLKAGTTPILYHHALKGIRPGEPIGLEDISFAGFGEFARQWMLLSRREAYEPGSGSHRLWLSVGGSAGQSGQWALDIDEGELGEDFSGRKWNVSVVSAAESRADAFEGKVTAKLSVGDEAKRRKHHAEEARVLDFLASQDKAGVGVKVRDVRASLGMNGDTIKAIVYRLVQAGAVERWTAKVGNQTAEFISKRDKRDNQAGLGLSHDA